MNTSPNGALEDSVAGGAAKGGERNLTLAEYLVGGFGGFLVGFTELLKSGSESTHVTVLRISAVLREHFSPALSAGWVALILLGIFSMLLCYVYRPASRKESFALGLSVFAVLTAVTPAQTPKKDVEEPPTVGWLSILPSAHAQDLKSDQVGDYYFEFEGWRSRVKSERVVMSVFDHKGKQLLQSLTVNARTVNKLQLKKGEYVLLFECSGCERTYVNLTIEKPVEGSRVTLDDSGVPLSLQRLFRPSIRDVEDLTPRSLDRVIAKFKAQAE
ncbi:hypothetical protein [Pseudoduganella sp. HUAS MS19]